MLDRFLILMLAGTALALGACGDDDDGGTTKAEFIEKADAICAEGEEQSQQLAREGLQNPQNPTGQEVLDILDKLVPIQRDTIAQVRELEKPEGDEDEIDAIYDAAQAANDKAKADPSLLTQEGADPFADANAKARAYGLKACGSS